MSQHQHTPAFIPPSGTGFAVCECGATQRFENGAPSGGWHSCPMCAHGVPRSDPKGGLRKGNRMKRGL